MDGIRCSIETNGQRNFITKGLKEAKNDDLILISDVDEIPNLENFKFDKNDLSFDQ